MVSVQEFTAELSRCRSDRRDNREYGFVSDNVVLYGQYILDRKLVRQRRLTKRVGLSV